MNAHCHRQSLSGPAQPNGWRRTRPAAAPLSRSPVVRLRIGGEVVAELGWKEKRERKVLSRSLR